MLSLLLTWPVPHHFEEESVTQVFPIKGPSLNEETMLFPRQKFVHDPDLVKLAVEADICGIQAQQILRYIEAIDMICYYSIVQKQH